MAEKTFLHMYGSIRNLSQGIISLQNPTNFLLLGLCGLQGLQDTQRHCSPKRHPSSQALLDQTQKGCGGAHSGQRAGSPLLRICVAHQAQETGGPSPAWAMPSGSCSWMSLRQGSQLLESTGQVSLGICCGSNARPEPGAFSSQQHFPRRLCTCVRAWMLFSWKGTHCCNRGTSVQLLHSASCNKFLC